MVDASPSAPRIRPPKQERSRKAFSAALDAFEELLRQRSVHDVSMQEVADRAGLSLTSVYARFDGKAALVLGLHERVIADGTALADLADADESLADLTLHDLVSRIVHSVGAFTESNEHVFRAVLATADREATDRIADFVRSSSERVAALLRDRIDGDRDTVERDLDFAWRSVIAMLQQRWMLDGADPARFPLETTELRDRLTAQFLDTVSTPH
ncbi:MAG: TetR/AcrR family transcriptional regulator [Ilumatobacter sp.]|jgi:AcrR family transcriptional regulator|uniref:TetR/AcrR family transcriptional regulator n=1 Tax=Ilumatobacter sp. TaxID=1967498 RepID=UPI003918C703